MQYIGIRDRTFRTGMKRFAGKPCPWCGKPMTTRANKENSPTRDHLVPRSLLSRGEMAVKIIVCRACNQSKKAFTLEAWLVRLRAGNDPRAPIVEAWMTANPGIMAQAKGLLNSVFQSMVDEGALDPRRRSA